jgi:hypothetical protein
MNHLRRFGKLDDYFALTTAEGVRPADFVEAASLQQVDVTQLARDRFLSHSIFAVGIIDLCRYRAEARDIVFTTLATVPLKLSR